MSQLRFFRLIRHVDTFGISGTGHIATGCLIQPAGTSPDSLDGTVIFTFATGGKMAQTTTVTTMELIEKFQCAKVSTTFADSTWHGKPSSSIVWYAADEPEPSISWSREFLEKITGPCVFN